MLFQPAKTTISDGSLVTPGVPTPMVRSGARARSQRMETSTLWRTAGCSESFFGGISPLFLKRLRLRSFEVAMEKFPPSYTLEKALLPRHLGQTLLPKQMPCYPSDEKPWSLSLQGWQTQYQIAVVKSDTWVYFHKLLFHTIPITYLPFRSLSCLRRLLPLIRDVLRQVSWRASMGQGIKGVRHWRLPNPRPKAWEYSNPV